MSKNDETSPHKAPPLMRYDELRSEGIFFSRPHLATLEARGEFPRRIRLGANSIAWDREAVRAWVARRRAESEKSP